MIFTKFKINNKKVNALYLFKLLSTDCKQLLIEMTQATVKQLSVLSRAVSWLLDFVLQRFDDKSIKCCHLSACFRELLPRQKPLSETNLMQAMRRRFVYSLFAIGLIFALFDQRSNTGDVRRSVVLLTFYLLLSLSLEYSFK